jgi:hypothetical protein
MQPPTSNPSNASSKGKGKKGKEWVKVPKHMTMTGDELWIRV